MPLGIPLPCISASSKYSVLSLLLRLQYLNELLHRPSPFFGPASELPACCAPLRVSPPAASVPPRAAKRVAKVQPFFFLPKFPAIFFHKIIKTALQLCPEPPLRTNFWAPPWKKTPIRPFRRPLCSASCLPLVHL